HQPNAYEAVGDQVATSPTKKKKTTRNHQKRSIQTNDAPRQTMWTTEEEVALAKGWRAISENSQHGNARKKDGIWCEVLAYIESKTKQEGRRTYDMVVGKWKSVCLAVVRFCGHFQTSTNGLREVARGTSHLVLVRSTESLGTLVLIFTVADEDEVQEIRRPGDRDKPRAAAKNKGSKASGSSTMNDNALARLTVNEMTADEVEQRDAFMELKRGEVECREREIAATEYRVQ
nr:hypothetical protein [Tanacetum cinerariifolium]